MVQSVMLSMEITLCGVNLHKLSRRRVNREAKQRY
ncbi:uncharacterized protein J3R85_017989 [Psidium guajava]|nr:uncharacterized protein J3R85_017989 [Psidium guajava]